MKVIINKPKCMVFSDLQPGDIFKTISNAEGSKALLICMDMVGYKATNLQTGEMVTVGMDVAVVRYDNVTIHVS